MCTDTLLIHSGRRWQSWLPIGIATFAIIQAEGATPFFIGAAAGLSYLIFFRRSLVAIGLTLGTFIGGYFWIPESFFRLAPRYEEWFFFMNWWKEHASIAVGTGIGTFAWLGPLLHLDSGRTAALFVWMHNDWIQIVFESGVIGGVLSLGVFLQSLYLARKNVAIFLGLVSYGTCMMAQFPLHYVLGQALAAALLCSAYTAPESGPHFFDSSISHLQHAWVDLRCKLRRAFPGRLRKSWPSF